MRDRTENVYLKAETALIDAQKQLILENYTKAFELFLVAQELDPNNAAVNYKLAEVLLKNGSPQKALAYSEKARELDPENKFFYIQNAEIAQKLGLLDNAITVYEEMLGRIPGTERYLYDLALLYQYKNRFDAALATYDRAKQFYGINEPLLLEKQKIYLKTGDLESLTAEWDELISNNPSEFRYVFRLTEILISNDRFDAAQERLLRFKERDPDAPEADLLLAKIEQKKGNYSKALDLLEGPVSSEDVTVPEKLKLLGGFLGHIDKEGVKAKLTELTLLLADKHPDTYQTQAFTGDVLYQIEEKEKAVGHYLKAIELSPGNFSVWQNTINLEFQLQHYDSVVEHSAKALEYFPNQAIFYFFNGVGNFIQKNYEKSVRALETGKVYTSDPSLLSEFYGQLGDAYNGLGEDKKSDEAYDQSLKYNPENDHVLNNYSYFLSLRNEYMDKAYSMSSRLIRMHPDNPTYLDTFGWVLYQQGKYKEAKKYLSRAAELNSEDGTILEHYGDVLYQLGEVDEAVVQWEKASQSPDASDNIQKKIKDKRIYE